MYFLLVEIDYQLDLDGCQHLDANNSYFNFLFIYSTKVRAVKRISCCGENTTLWLLLNKLKRSYWAKVACH